MDWTFTLSELDMLIMLCFLPLAYSQGAHVNPPPLGLVFYVCDPRYE